MSPPRDATHQAVGKIKHHSTVVVDRRIILRVLVYHRKEPTNRRIWLGLRLFGLDRLAGWITGFLASARMKLMVCMERLPRPSVLTWKSQRWAKLRLAPPVGRRCGPGNMPTISVASTLAKPAVPALHSTSWVMVVLLFGSPSSPGQGPFARLCLDSSATQLPKTREPPLALAPDHYDEGHHNGVRWCPPMSRLMGLCTAPPCCAERHRPVAFGKRSL